MDERFYAWVDKLFQPYPSSKRIWELKEEMIANLNDKYNDYIMQGCNQDEAFRLSIDGIGDIAEIDEIKEISKIAGISKTYNEKPEAAGLETADKRNAILARLIKHNYWQIVVMVYLVLSFAFGMWEYSWLIYPLAAIFRRDIIALLSIRKSKESPIIDYTNKV